MGRLSNRDKCVAGRVLNRIRCIRGRQKGRRERNLDIEKARGQEVKGSNTSEITNLIGPGLVISWEQGSTGAGS
jgi:hypothetical protein